MRSLRFPPLIIQKVGTADPAGHHLGLLEPQLWVHFEPPRRAVSAACPPPVPLLSPSSLPELHFGSLPSFLFLFSYAELFVYRRLQEESRKRRNGNLELIVPLGSDATRPL